MIREDAERVVDQLTISYAQLRKRTVLVTGATGMVGRYCVEIMLECSRRLDGTVRVVALARDAAKARSRLGQHFDKPNFELRIGDTVDPAAFSGLPTDFVIHAASPARPDAFRADPVGVIHANVIGTDLLLNLLRQQGHGYLCFVSTMEIYGDVSSYPTADHKTISENTPGTLNSLDLRSAYPESKRLAENLCIAYGAQHAVRSDIVRLSHTYGPGMELKDPRVQAEFVRRALAGDEIVLKSDGSLSRTYTYAADAAAAIMYVMLSAEDRSEPSAFNVADEGSRVSIRQLAEAVLAAAGRDKADLKLQPIDPSEQMWSRVATPVYLDCARIQELGWQATRSLDEGIPRMITYISGSERGGEGE